VRILVENGEHLPRPHSTALEKSGEGVNPRAELSVREPPVAVHHADSARIGGGRALQGGSNVHGPFLLPVDHVVIAVRKFRTVGAPPPIASASALGAEGVVG